MLINAEEMSRQAAEASIATINPNFSIIYPMATGPIKPEIETAKTTIAEADAVRSGNASQQRITRAGTAAPCRRPPGTTKSIIIGVEGASRKHSAKTAAEIEIDKI